jgi:hypothetical protein
MLGRPGLIHDLDRSTVERVERTHVIDLMSQRNSRITIPIRLLDKEAFFDQVS